MYRVPWHYSEQDEQEKPMSRVVPAARQLLAEVKSVTGKDGEALTEVDGLGFQRSVRLSPAISKALGEDVLTALEDDPRIEAIVKSSKGSRVTFVADTRADLMTEFGLASVVEAE
jgi:hypothetical protein